MHRVCDVCAHIWPGFDAASSKHNISISKNENNNNCSRNQNKMKWNESRMGSVLSQGKWMNANWFLDTHMHSNGFVSFSDSTHENTLIIFPAHAHFAYLLYDFYWCTVVVWICVCKIGEFFVRCWRCAFASAKSDCMQSFHFTLKSKSRWNLSHN